MSALQEVSEFWRSFVGGTIELRSQGLRNLSMRSWIIEPDFYKGRITDVKFDGTFVNFTSDSITKGKHQMLDSRSVLIDTRMILLSEEGSVYRIVGYSDPKRDRPYEIFLHKPQPPSVKSGLRMEIL